MVMKRLEHGLSPLKHLPWEESVVLILRDKYSIAEITVKRLSRFHLMGRVQVYMELVVGPPSKRFGTQSRQGVGVDRMAPCYSGHDLPKVRACV